MGKGYKMEIIIPVLMIVLIIVAVRRTQESRGAEEYYKTNLPNIMAKKVVSLVKMMLNEEVNRYNPSVKVSSHNLSIINYEIGIYFVVDTPKKTELINLLNKVMAGNSDMSDFSLNGRITDEEPNKTANVNLHYIIKEHYSYNVSEFIYELASEIRQGCSKLNTNGLWIGIREGSDLAEISIDDECTRVLSEPGNWGEYIESSFPWIYKLNRLNQSPDLFKNFNKMDRLIYEISYHIVLLLKLMELPDVNNWESKIELSLPEGDKILGNSLNVRYVVYQGIHEGSKEYQNVQKYIYDNRLLHIFKPTNDLIGLSLIIYINTYAIEKEPFVQAIIDRVLKDYPDFDANQFSINVNQNLSEKCAIIITKKKSDKINPMESDIDYKIRTRGWI